MLNPAELRVLARALDKMADGFSDLPTFTPDVDEPALAEVLDLVAERMQDNFPYFHPRYAGQMLKPPHPVARLAYALSLWINPNNHALDGSRASSPMEKACIVDLGRLYGWDAPLGHLTSSGTIANLEALWVAGCLHPGQRIVASSQAHYTHSRLTDVLGLPFTPVPVTRDGRMNVAALEELLQAGDVGTVVATIGTTGLGAVDPLPDILDLRDQFSFRVHADAAYGGYFGLSNGLRDETRATYEHLAKVDSIVVDPHKHGLQPYGCGCILFRDPDVGRFYKHESPFTYFTSDELHLGEISLECSRAGASAVALWATHRLLPPVRGGQFARGLDSCLDAAAKFWRRLGSMDAYRPLMRPELDIVVFAVSAKDAKTASRRARRVFQAAAERDLHLALFEVPMALAHAWLPDLEANAETLTCLRSTLMKPEHREWLDDILLILDDVAHELD